jgi:hypothetical protein
MWRMLRSKQNRELIGFLAGGVAAILAAGWAVFTYLAPAERDKDMKACTIDAKDSAVACGDIRGNVNIQSPTK